MVICSLSPTPAYKGDPELSVMTWKVPIAVMTFTLFFAKCKKNMSVKKY